MDTELLKGTLALLILSLLSRKAMYGYEIAATVHRGIGGPRSLRQHVRQELREHLLDAAADHRAAGLSEEEALARALADFGGPEQVRSELEATHGHRLLPVVIDKALEWKERTMRAKW